MNKFFVVKDPTQHSTPEEVLMEFTTNDHAKYVIGCGLETTRSKWAGLAVDSVIRGEPVPPRPCEKKYFVHWGYMHRHVEEFTDFQRALDHLADHRGGPSGARLVGEGYDADCDEDGFHEVSDGLTDDERARVEALP